MKDYFAGKTVVVHPTVLLSVVDHYNRTCKGAANKRAVGSLCGEIRDGNIHITNCYAVPFEEDSRDPRVWYLDHLYHDNMFYMMKKVNAKERFMGWYSTGPRIKPADLEIHQLYRKFTPEPVFLIVDVQMPKEEELPLEAYYCVDEKSSDPQFKRTFLHLPVSVDAYEAEEVGVEHLLRDMKNFSASSLATRVQEKTTSLKCLVGKLKDISEYLANVQAGKLPPNHHIISNIQDIFNRLPDTDSEEMIRAFAVGTNDMSLALYVGNLLRTTIALHNLINTKIEKEESAEDKKKKEKEKKEADEKEKGGEKKGGKDAEKTDEKKDDKKQGTKDKK
jgi:26S proteasome regulatory subunit N8